MSGRRATDDSPLVQHIRSRKWTHSVSVRYDGLLVTLREGWVFANTHEAAQRFPSCNLARLGCTRHAVLNERMMYAEAKWRDGHVHLREINRRDFVPSHKFDSFATAAEYVKNRYQLTLQE